MLAYRLFFLSLFFSVTILSCQNAQSLYAEDAIKVISSNNILNGNTSILKYYESREPEGQNIELFKVNANKKRAIHYMIEARGLEKGNKEILLSIYTDKNNLKHTVFEYSSPKSNCDTELIKAQISDNRSKWMSLCNAHQVEELVNSYYSSNTIYYNHKPLVIGREDLIKEYSYMNRENYSLSLNPLFIEVVNDETVFEIGQCVGSYGGNYILIWKKDDDGKWRIFIDSNI